MSDAVDPIKADTIKTDTIKADLKRYLQAARDAVVWKLDGLSEYDMRRPLTPTGTNLLGLVKHLAWIEIGYFGDTFGRPFGESVPWADTDEENADMWATESESSVAVVDAYRRVCAHSDRTIDEVELNSRIGTVPWWPAEANPVSLARILIHVIAETNRHAGQADIVRESIDGAAGLRADNANMRSVDEGDWWSEYYAKLERTARAFR